jgi:hypothetical protein
VKTFAERRPFKTGATIPPFWIFLVSGVDRET